MYLQIILPSRKYFQIESPFNTWVWTVFSADSVAICIKLHSPFAWTWLHRMFISSGSEMLLLVRKCQWEQKSVFHFYFQCSTVFTHRPRLSQSHHVTPCNEPQSKCQKRLIISINIVTISPYKEPRLLLFVNNKRVYITFVKIRVQLLVTPYFIGDVPVCRILSPQNIKSTLLYCGCIDMESLHSCCTYYILFCWYMYMIDECK